MVDLASLRARLENALRAGGACVLAEDSDQLVNRILSQRIPNAGISDRDVLALKNTISQECRNAYYASAKSAAHFEDYEFLLPPLLRLDDDLRRGRAFSQESEHDMWSLWRLGLEFGRGLLYLQRCILARTKSSG